MNLHAGLDAETQGWRKALTEAAAGSLDPEGNRAVRPAVALAR